MLADMENLSNTYMQKSADQPVVRSSRTPGKLLVVEDEPDISSLLVYTLGKANFQVKAVADCASAWQHIADDRPDLMLLDWMLPDMSGIEMLQRIRKHADYSEMPVIMLTARSEESDRVRGLDSGADDYIVKPFSLRELCSRINSRLRIVASNSPEILEADGMTLDTQSHRLGINGEMVNLGPTEFRLLRHFMENTERVYSRAQLLDRVWGTNVYVEERTVDVHILRLRKALEPCGKAGMIQTVRGAGYRFSGQG